jgi:hypothetical protein
MMNKKVKSFIEFARSETKEYGVKFYLTKYKRVIADGVKVSGYWDDENKVLAVATGCPTKKWFPIFVHEFAHFTQWRDKRKVYTKLCDKKFKEKYGDDPEDIFFKWLNGKDYPTSLVKKAVGIIRDMELDCERLTLDFIKEFDLPIDQLWQCQAASAYIHFYNVIVDTRKWYKKSPFFDKKLLAMMPRTLRGDYKKTPKKIVEAIKEFM